MINVLIVEDDKLVRKSFISAFRWNNFDMEVVGDAKNGKVALDFIEQHAVDLVITDLAMPVMSGIELIRVLRQQYPEIFVVVLSLHQDFEYIQEAMRLGAIDYIAKIELDGTDMDNILVRIQDRIEQESNNRHGISKASTSPFRNGYLILSHHLQLVYERLADDIQQDQMYTLHDVAIVIDQQAISPEDMYHRLAASIGNLPPVVLIYPEKSSHILDLTAIDLRQLLFYEVSEENRLSFISCKQLPVFEAITDQEMDQWKEQLLSWQWLTNQETVQQLLDKLYQAAMTTSQLQELFHWFVSENKRLYQDIFPKDIAAPNSLHAWSDVEAWLHHVQRQMYTTVFSPTYSVETNQCILKAVSIIEKELATPLTAQDVALQVNMSRSYFSTCFKDIVGETFHEYVRIARINKAKDYLVYTKEKVGVISEKVGYADIKYFSKMFRKSTGQLPSEYRKWHKVRLQSVGGLPPTDC
ncbi:response regulator [Gracilibacillus caseinilyticus]|uniref:Response regulator n=1 Tax=Gracilibacillus caseinilyticus TaxID=2932256 RepID=A0ABY4EQL1_9BACI|nr:response regulator [Gracilibacillus caseinilyticus]UOQ46650.1 response regulator [Gracilibacillus caseinilyticus]